MRGDRSAGAIATNAAIAGLASGIPSTVHALVTGHSPLRAARGAGALLGKETLARGLVAHAVMSIGWTAVFAAVLPRRRRVLAGAAGGLAVAALDLWIARRRFPAIADLPVAGQVADHVAFGVLVAALLDRR